ncbi:MAG: hypothetical protein RID07_17190, partial [Lacipirellulaceae bacterium]
ALRSGEPPPILAFRVFFTGLAFLHWLLEVFNCYSAQFTRRLKTEYFAMEIQCGLVRLRNGIRFPVAVLLTLKGYVGSRHAFLYQGLESLLRLLMRYNL